MKRFINSLSIILTAAVLSLALVGCQSTAPVDLLLLKKARLLSRRKQVHFHSTVIHSLMRQFLAKLKSHTRHSSLKMRLMLSSLTPHRIMVIFFQVFTMM